MGRERRAGKQRATKAEAGEEEKGDSGQKREVTRSGSTALTTDIALIVMDVVERAKPFDALTMYCGERRERGTGRVGASHVPST